MTGRGGSDEETKPDYIRIGCDFAKKPGMERCFGGIGSQCDGIIQSQVLGMGLVPFTEDESTCRVEGQVSVGSILHDRCCRATGNEGWSCRGLNAGDASRCREEWQIAWDSTQCTVIGSSRQWAHSFGPYPLGTTGDVVFMTDESIPVAIKAPAGTRMIPGYQDHFCQSGRCREENGVVRTGRDLCGEYCTCA